MKKLLAVLAIAGTLVACNNDATDTTTTDSTTITTDNSTMMTDTTNMMNDTSSMMSADSTNK